VASDTSVLCYLVLIGRIDLLKSLFGEITIPGQVLAECLHPGAPPSLRREFSTPLPSFITIAEVGEFLPETATLDPGEAAAITLAWQHRSHSLLLLDEKRGRAIAAALGLQIRGILGIVVEGHRRGLLEFDPMIALLRSHGFRIADALLSAARENLSLESG
jgi:uncharacterized protein